MTKLTVVSTPDAPKAIGPYSQAIDDGAMNEVYAKHFGSHRPARSTVAVAGLPKGARVEIDVVAHKN